MNFACNRQSIQINLNESADALCGLKTIIAVLAREEAIRDPAAFEQVSLALTFALAECARRVDEASCALDALDAL